MQFLTSCFHLNNRYFLLSVEYIFFYMKCSSEKCIHIDIFIIRLFSIHTWIIDKYMFHRRVKCWIQNFNTRPSHEFNIFPTNIELLLLFRKQRNIFRVKNVCFWIYYFNLYNGLEFLCSKYFKNYIWVLLQTILQIEIQRVPSKHR